MLILILLPLVGLATWSLGFREGAGGPEASKPLEGVPGYVFVPDDRLPGPGRGAGEFPGADLERQPEPIRRAIRANVKIESPRSMGSGVVIERRGDDALILTFLHSFSGFAPVNATEADLKAVSPIRITYFDGQHRPGRVVWVDGVDGRQTGLVLLKAPAPGGVEPAAWDPDSELAIGQEVFSVGNPVGAGWTLARAIVSSRRGQKSGNARGGDIITYDPKTALGTTGGGLYNADGVLIGINRSIPSVSAPGSLVMAVGLQPIADLSPEGLAPRPKGP